MFWGDRNLHGIGPVISRWRRIFSLRLAGFVTIILLLHQPSATAWGCRGHETLALIALRYMTAPHADATNALLSKFPSTTKIACKDVAGMAVSAHESSWADDYRISHPETGAFHFLDLPLSGTADMDALCASGCTPHAIRDEIAVFLNNLDTPAAADALRFHYSSRG